jgi:hypothetical protein
LTSTIEIIPRPITYDLLLTATTGISHHDPAVQDDSNRQLFNRQKQLLSCGLPALNIGQERIDAVCQAWPVPETIVDIFREGITFPEFVATALCRLFMDLYNSQEGEGLFSGEKRYSRLESRLMEAAIARPNLYHWWDLLTKTMNVSIHSGDEDARLFGLLSLPIGLQQSVLRILTDDYRSTVSLARLWHTENKLTNARYAAAVKRDVIENLVVLSFSADDISTPTAGVRGIQVPAVSGNSLRHQVVRGPSWQHLRRCLGLAEAFPGQGPVPAGTEAIFYNGGNIKAGAKQPSSSFSLAAEIRQRYPSLDLLGGVTDSFDLGESRLSVAGWLICRENRDALKGTAAMDRPIVNVSASDMLDDVTETRQASPSGAGQMIHGFEILCPGTEILVRLTLSPWTPLLTHGALLAAVEEYLAVDPTIGGQAARGFGRCRGYWLACPGDFAGLRRQYEEYLVDNKDALVAGMADGTMGTGHKVLS